MINSATPLMLAMVGFFGAMASAVPVVNTAQGATKYFWRTPQGSGDVILTSVRDNNGYNVLNEQRYFWGIPFDHKQYFNESLYVPGYTPNQNAPGNVWSQDGAPRLRRQYDAAGSQQLFYLRSGRFDQSCVEVNADLPGVTFVDTHAQCSNHKQNAVDWFQQPRVGKDQYVIGYINKNNDGSVASAACMSNTGSAATLVPLDTSRYGNDLKNGNFPWNVCNVYTGVDLAYF